MGVDLLRICALKDGRTYAVENDVLGVAKDLFALSTSIAWRYPEAIQDSLQLRLRYSVSSDLFIVYVEYLTANHGMQQELVTAAPECDGRLFTRVQQIAHPSYDFLMDMEASDREKQREIDHKFNETMGELAQQLAHAVRKDMGIFFKSFIPRDIDGDLPRTSG